MAYPDNLPDPEEGAGDDRIHPDLAAEHHTGPEADHRNRLAEGNLEEADRTGPT